MFIETNKLMQPDELVNLNNLRNAIDYTMATVSSGNSFPANRDGWVEIHRGRAHQSHAYLQAAKGNIERLKAEQETLKDFWQEMKKLSSLALKLDSMNPEIPGAFTGTVSDRIKRQLVALGVIES